MIKQPAYLILSIVLLLVVGYFVVDRINFLSSAERTTGKVISLSSHNDRCGGRRSRYACTKYDATVRFSAGGQGYSYSIGAGSARGYDKPTNLADRKVGQSVATVYNPKNPKEVYEDTFMGVWGLPFMIFIGQIISFFVSFTEPRRRTQSL